MILDLKMIQVLKFIHKPRLIQKHPKTALNKNELKGKDHFEIKAYVEASDLETKGYRLGKAITKTVHIFNPLVFGIRVDFFSQIFDVEINGSFRAFPIIRPNFFN